MCPNFWMKKHARIMEWSQTCSAWSYQGRKAPMGNVTFLKCSKTLQFQINLKLIMKNKKQQLKLDLAIIKTASNQQLKKKLKPHKNMWLKRANVTLKMMTNHFLSSSKRAVVILPPLNLRIRLYQLKTLSSKWHNRIAIMQQPPL